MMLIWSSGEDEADDFIFMPLYVGVSRLNSFVGRSIGLSHDGVVKSRCNDFKRFF